MGSSKFILFLKFAEFCRIAEFCNFFFFLFVLFSFKGALRTLSSTAAGHSQVRARRALVHHTGRRFHPVRVELEPLDTEWAISYLQIPSLTLSSASSSLTPTSLSLSLSPLITKTYFFKSQRLKSAILQKITTKPFSPHRSSFRTEKMSGRGTCLGEGATNGLFSKNSNNKDKICQR